MRRRMIDRLVRLLTSAARGSDTIGRLSEAEFAVLAPDADTSGVMKMARRIASAAMTKGTKRNQLSRLCIGCYAVADFSEASMEPVEILIRGLMALRCAQRDGAGDPIRFFDLSQPVIVLS
jgi:GGDEF domain-containing protein